MRIIWIGALLALVLGIGCPKPSDPCDIDGDGKGSTSLDVAAFQDALGAQKGEPRFNERADFDGDEVVSVNDFGLFMQKCSIEEKTQ